MDLMELQIILNFLQQEALDRLHSLDNPPVQTMLEKQLGFLQEEAQICKIQVTGFLELKTIKTILLVYLLT